MSINQNPYDSLFEKILEIHNNQLEGNTSRTITVHCTDPQKVRVGLAKARERHNKMCTAFGMELFTAKLVVAAIKGKANTYTISAKEPINQFMILDDPLCPD